MAKIEKTQNCMSTAYKWVNKANGLRWKHDGACAPGGSYIRVTGCTVTCKIQSTGNFARVTWAK